MENENVIMSNIGHDASNTILYRGQVRFPGINIVMFCRGKYFLFLLAIKGGDRCPSRKLLHYLHKLKIFIYKVRDC